MLCRGGRITGAGGGYTASTFSAVLEVSVTIINESPVELLFYFLGGEGGQVG